MACILAVMAAILVIYDLTMFPTISGGDSGELVGIACVGGVAHPPGYPLWLIMSRTFMAVLDLTPLNSKNMAWRLNFLSALLGAGASGGLALCIAAPGHRGPTDSGAVVDIPLHLDCLLHPVGLAL